MFSKTAVSICKHRVVDIKYMHTKQWLLRKGNKLDVYIRDSESEVP